MTPGEAVFAVAMLVTVAMGVAYVFFGVRRLTDVSTFEDEE